MIRLLCNSILLVLAIATSVSAFAETVTVPDGSLRKVLQEILKRKGIEKETLDSEDLETIHYLDGSNRGLTDLTGLERCTELQEARLNNNSIKDVSPLSACVKMRSLDVSANQVLSVAPLKTLTEIRYLNIENNSVKELSCVKSMPHLTALFASGNEISDVSPLKGLIRLHSLYLANNKVSDLSVLATLKNLVSLDLRRNEVVDVSPLKSLNRLRWTFLSENKVSDIEPLAIMASKDKNKEFAPYWRLFLEGNPLADDSKEHLRVLEGAGVTVRLKSEPKSPAGPADETAAQSGN